MFLRQTFFIILLLCYVFNKSNALIEEPRTGFPIQNKIYNLNYVTSGITILREPLRWYQRMFGVNSTLSSIAFYADNNNNYAIASKIYFYRWLSHGLRKSDFTEHTLMVMKEQNENEKSDYFTKSEFELTEECLKTRSFLGYLDEFVFVFNNKEKKVRFVYKENDEKGFKEIATYPMTLESFKKYYNLLLKRYIKTDNCKTDDCKKQLSVNFP